jgi:hypothetical protein
MSTLMEILEAYTRNMDMRRISRVKHAFSFAPERLFEGHARRELQGQT